MTDIVRSDAATLAAKIAAKELSSTEVTQALSLIHIWWAAAPRH